MGRRPGVLKDRQKKFTLRVPLTGPQEDCFQELQRRESVVVETATGTPAVCTREALGRKALALLARTHDLKWPADFEGDDVSAA